MIQTFVECWPSSGKDLADTKIAMSAFAVAALCLSQSPLGSLATEMGVPYDPQNGFFEIVLAGRQLRTGLSPFQKTLDERRNGAEATDPAFQKMTALAIRRSALTEFKSSADLLDAARSKNIWDPRPESSRSSKVVSVAGLMAVARFSVDFRAEVEFADGRPHAATACLRDAMRSSEAATSIGDVSGFLSAVVNNRLVFEAVSKHLPHLSLPDCLALEAAIDPMLDGRPSLLAGMQREIRAKAVALDLIRRMPRAELDENGLGFLAGLAEPELARYISEAKDLHRRQMSDLAAPLVMTLPDLAAFVDNQKPLERPDAQSLEQMPIPVRILAQISVDSLGSVPSAALVQEVQIGLLKAALAVNRFRWTYDQLPPKLTAAGPPEVMTDPLSGQLFRFKILDGEFELSSVGSRVTGPISLSHRGGVAKEDPGCR